MCSPWQLWLVAKLYHFFPNKLHIIVTYMMSWKIEVRNEKIDQIQHKIAQTTVLGASSAHRKINLFFVSKPQTLHRL